MTDDLVEAGLAALREAMLGECLHALPDGSCDLSACQCRHEVRAVLAAVEPKIRADERERAAKIAEDRNAGLDPPDGGAPTPREMCLNIAVAIRDGKEETDT